VIRSYVRVRPAFLVPQTRGCGARAWIDVIWLGDTLLSSAEVKPVAVVFPVQGTSSFPQKARSYFSKPYVGQLDGPRPRVKVRGSLGNGHGNS
jgi:hypothetical protein